MANLHFLGVDLASVALVEVEVGLVSDHYDRKALVSPQKNDLVFYLFKILKGFVVVDRVDEEEALAELHGVVEARALGTLKAGQIRDCKRDFLLIDRKFFFLLMI